MKKNFLLLFFLAVLTISCESNYEKKINRMIGTWLLDKMVYENASGKTIEVTDSEIILIFKDEDDPDNPTGGNVGVLIVDKYIDPYRFIYSLDFSGSSVDLSFHPDDIKKLPVEAVGKSQVYDLKLIDKNTLELYASAEVVPSTKEIIKNVTYTFIRKQ